MRVTRLIWALVTLHNCCLVMLEWSSVEGTEIKFKDLEF